MSEEVQLMRIADALEKILERMPKYLDHNLNKIGSQMERQTTGMEKIAGNTWAIANPELKKAPDPKKVS